jgi:hypothetical protein
MKGSHTAPPATCISRTAINSAKGTATAKGGMPISPISPAAAPPPPGPPWAKGGCEPPPPDWSTDEPELPGLKVAPEVVLGLTGPDPIGVVAIDADGLGVSDPSGIEGRGSEALMDGNGSGALTDGRGSEALTDGTGRLTGTSRM